MEIQQLVVKVLAKNDSLAQEELIPIFHRWIREKRLGEVLLIDVADYSHVPDGPGVMLIAHEGHYGLDAGGGHLGLRYARKRDTVDDANVRLREAFHALLVAGDALEKEPSVAEQLAFDPGQLEIRVMSRLVAPNSPETYAAFKPLLEAFLTELYGTADIEFEHLDDPKEAFGVRVRIAGEHALGTLLARLAN